MEYPTSFEISSALAAKVCCGKSPPTVLTIAIRDRYLEPPSGPSQTQGLTHARILKRFCFWFGVNSNMQFQSLSCTTTRSFSAETRSSRALGGNSNSMAARLPRMARSTAILGAEMDLKPSRYGNQPGKSSKRLLQ